MITDGTDLTLRRNPVSGVDDVLHIGLAPVVSLAAKENMSARKLVSYVHEQYGYVTFDLIGVRTLFPDRRDPAILTRE